MQQESQSSSNVSLKSAASYALLPGVLPWIQRVVFRVSGLMFTFTQIFGSVGLIDRNHPCLRPENIGRYRFVDIIGMAAGNLVFDKKHLPQIIMFFAVVMTLLLMAGLAAAFLIITVLNVGQAHAQFFGTPDQAPDGAKYQSQQDWALQFLYRIFGISSFFPEPVAGSGSGNPWFIALLVGMLKYYSLAILVIAAFTLLYILVMTLTEAAKSGKPFGSRFDGIWAPVRIALAIGLLVPIASPGYNGAQLFVFQAAVWGSNLATNTWYGGLEAIKGKEGEKFFATTMSDPGYRFVRDMFLVNLCLEGLRLSDHKAWGIGNINMVYTGVAYKDSIVYDFGPADVPGFCGQVKITRRLSSNIGPSAKDGNWIDQVGSDYQEIAKAFMPIPRGASLIGAVQDVVSKVVPITVDDGSIVLPTTMGPAATYAAEQMMSTGSKEDMDFVKVMNQGGSPAVGPKPIDWIKLYWRKLGVQCADGSPLEDGKPCAARTPFFATGAYPSLVSSYNNWMTSALFSDARFGWTTAGVFYLRMSSAMSAISNAVNSPPTVTRLPSNMSKAFATADNPTANTQLVADKCSNGLYAWWTNLTSDDLCAKYELSLKMNSFLQGGANWFQSSVHNDSAAWALAGGLSFDRALDLPDPETSNNLQAGLILRPILDGLMEFAHIDSKDLNPLGAVVSWGNALINLGIVAYGLALIAPGAGLTSLAFSLGNLLLLAGFVLAFWIPMVPFMYFMFAVVEWMMSVLEAVIGMPLWALSMVTLNGDGLGDTATKGFKMIVEIILRPTIIVLSLLISIIMFTASVSYLNSAIDLYASASSTGKSGISLTGVTSTVATGFGMVFIYMMGVYSLATSCFKLISVIPNSFGRWGGLPAGFGAQIKTGPESVGTLTQFVVAGVGIKKLGDITGSVGKAKAARNQKKASDKVKGTDGG